MAKVLKKSKSFHLSFGVIFRWLLFAFGLYLAIGYLSANRLNLTTDISLPTLTATDSAETQDFSQKINHYQQKVVNFVNRQVTEIKKGVVTKIYENIINSIEQK